MAFTQNDIVHAVLAFAIKEMLHPEILSLLSGISVATIRETIEGIDYLPLNELG